MGFRPFVYRLARAMRLGGWVCNSSQGVTIEVEGDPDAVHQFQERLCNELPFPAKIEHYQAEQVACEGESGFRILPSKAEGDRLVPILPDLAPCPACLQELFDPSNRRYRYPFINCTHCGPRFSIIEGLPYDRPQTTMKTFTQCDECQHEYEDPGDRRFHAQPNACPVCGPYLSFYNAQQKCLSTHDDALMQAVEAIREGYIVAMKGVGGFHLVVDAQNAIAVSRLRLRKLREEKPLAVMYPSLEAIEQTCMTNSLERERLQSPQGPIVLLRRSAIDEWFLAHGIAPNNPLLGCMLPYSPLHHLLMAELGFPIVATSANRSDEPICIDNQEAFERLANIADYYLVHNRPIARPVDDSVVRIVEGRELLIRRSRGYAPLPISIDAQAPPTLSVGAQQKNTVAINIGSQILLSQHVGDLDNPASLQTFEEAIHSLSSLYPNSVQHVVCDLHPDYASTRYAQQKAVQRHSLQHHYAHILACMAEHRLEEPVLGVAWDGTGYGEDGTIWGGEFLQADWNGYRRAAYFRNFRLPGGEVAVYDLRRSALGVLLECYGESAFEHNEIGVIQALDSNDIRVLRQLIRHGINCPYTTSMGRLFDAVASIAGLRTKVSYQGQAAQELEWAIDLDAPAQSYAFELRRESNEPDAPYVIDWAPMVADIVKDVINDVSTGAIALRFHETLIEIICHVSVLLNAPKVALGGGCFQNAYLLSHSVQRLRQAGREVYWPHKVPPNDGGIALGQAAWAAKHLAQSKPSTSEEQSSCA